MDKIAQYKEKIKPVVIRNLNDIKLALKPFLLDASDQDRTMQCEMSWDNDGKMEKSVVTGKSASFSYRQTLIDGLEVVKKRQETMKKLKEAVDKIEDEDFKPTMDVWDINKITFNIDTLIQRRLGGTRNGLRVRWSVAEGIFEYDPYQDKLFEIEGEK
jgi:hypothetical protein